ncbi:hypothetical protein ACEZ3G_11970 [Maribacter algicola]|uniref:Uncharacterized protein n=1 Tax=Meishania litoralis TaxID=3434685 RepID=A0ACC7LK82_9FLAO
MELPENYSEFQDSLSEQNPSNNWPEGLKALWHEAKGDWEASHDIAQEMQSTLGSWIHAYLHRKEGDEWNAGYWYRRAGRPFPKITLEQELQTLVEFVLYQ